MKKHLLFLLVPLLILAGCSANELPLDQGGSLDVEPANADTVSPEGSQGITVNNIPFQLTNSKNDLTERGYLVEALESGYLITICSGEKPSAGYSISVQSVEDNEGKTIIVVEETGPGNESDATVISYPAVTISIGSNIAPNFQVMDSKGNLFPQLSLSPEVISPTPWENNPLEATESDQIEGWKKLTARVQLQELTEWGSTHLENAPLFAFSVHFPGSWSFDGSSVFYDQDQKKIAELPPPVLLKPEDESLFLENRQDMNWVDELVSHQDIQINGYPGSKTVIRVGTESGSWYPHIYRISTEECGFCIIFYSQQIDQDDGRLFEQIIHTFAAD